MDLSKNYVLKFMRESQESDFTNDAPLESVQNVSEQTQGWSFTEHDMAFSECPTYVYNGDVQCKTLGGDGELDPLDVNSKWDVMSPNIEEIQGLNGILTLIYCKSVADTPNEDQDEFGFEIDVFTGENDENDHMIYGYAKDLNGLKELMNEVGKYFDLPTDIPYEDFAAKVQGNAPEQTEVPAEETPEAAEEPVGESNTSEGIVDDIKSDIKNSKTLKSVQAGLAKIKERFQKTIEAAKKLFAGKQYVYTYKANGNATFSLKGELEVQADNGEYVYIEHKDLFSNGRNNEWESPYWEVEEGFLNDEPAERLYEEEDLAEYLDDTLKKVIVSIKFKGFPSLTGSDGGFMHEWTIISKKQLSEEQIAELKSYMDGQMSDGLGEGFEQHPIDTEMEIWEDGVEIPNPDYDPNRDYDDDEEEESDEDDNPEYLTFRTIHENADVEVYIHLWCQQDFSSKIEFEKEEVK